MKYKWKQMEQAQAMEFTKYISQGLSILDWLASSVSEDGETIPDHAVMSWLSAAVSHTTTNEPELTSELVKYLSR